MPATTTPDALKYPVGGDALTPLRLRFKDLADTVQTALTSRFRGTNQKAQGLVFNSASARNAALPSPSPGDTVFRSDLGWTEVYLAGPPAGWSPIVPGFVGCKLGSTGGQSSSPTANTFVAVSFTLEDYDPQGMHDPATPTRITVPSTGYYRVKGKLSYSAGATGAVGIAVNGAPHEKSLTYVQFASGAFADPSVDTVLKLNAGQYVELLSGSTTASAPLFTNRCYFELQLVGTGA